MSTDTINATCIANLDSLDDILAALEKDVAVEMDPATFVRFVKTHGRAYFRGTDWEDVDWALVFEQAWLTLSSSLYHSLSEHEVLALAHADRHAAAARLRAAGVTCDSLDTPSPGAVTESDRAFAIAGGHYYGGESLVRMTIAGAGTEPLMHLVMMELFNLLPYC